MSKRRLVPHSEELDPCHAGQTLAGDNDGDISRLLLRSPKHSQALIGRSSKEGAVVGVAAPAQVIFELLPDVLLVLDCQ